MFQAVFSTVFPAILRITVISITLVATSCTHLIATEPAELSSAWLLVDDFEGALTLQDWTNVDAQNDTRPFVANPQICEIRTVSGTANQYMLRKPAADGVVGNRKAIGFKPLPVPIEVGETATLYTRINVEYFPNNQSYGLSNATASDIPKLAYDALEPMIRITDKTESDGQKNNGTLMVLDGYKTYANIKDSKTGDDAKPLEPGQWYEVWAVINNAPKEAGGQSYDLYVRGGEFTSQQQVFEGAVFRMNRARPLGFFMTISNTGPQKAPYGNGGVRYDDIYIAKGEVLSTPP